MSGAPKSALEGSKIDEPGRAESSRGDAPKNIGPHRVVAESPREFATDIVKPADGSTLLVQPATKETSEKGVEPAKDHDTMSSAEKRSKPTFPLSQAPVASMDVVEIEQPANPPKNALSSEANHQIVTKINQEKIDAAAQHRTVLKEIWERRVS